MGPAGIWVFFRGMDVYATEGVVGPTVGTQAASMSVRKPSTAFNWIFWDNRLAALIVRSVITIEPYEL
jgi:hypothetical protein